jgi:hypothetical protein
MLLVSQRTIESLVGGIISGGAVRYITSYVRLGFIKRLSFENALTVGLRDQSGGAAVIEDHSVCMRWWKSDRQYSGSD